MVCAWESDPDNAAFVQVWPEELHRAALSISGLTSSSTTRGPGTFTRGPGSASIARSLRGPRSPAN
jgi:hypothetical protein